MNKKNEFELPKLVEHLSHELRTPLSAILGYSELLEKSNNLDESEKKHLEKIAASGTQLLDVVNDLIEISNIESGNVLAEENVIKTDELVAELKSEFETAARIKELDLLISIGSAVKETFIGDEKKVKTILYSLINNAIKFTKKGKIKVEISISEISDRLLCFKIEDTGIGISEEDMKHVFKPFWQANVKQKTGTGLGLTTCQKLVHILDGSLDITSVQEKGTRIVLQIPIGEDAGNAVSKENKYASKVELSAKKSLKALIVDDLPINRALARIMLEMKDFEIIEAENGKEALDSYAGNSPDVVLMDISMPVMNGIEAMEKIRNINGSGKDIPIIAITAGGHMGTRSELINKGFSEYIQKPFKEKELFEKISLFLPLTVKNLKRAPLKQISVKS
ncbi:MAG: response regulator [Gracilimonas sp.]|uniref:response regulator n=1 Tax=Gracilimonas sp. TaxID=1974203 RepID=UPI0019C865AD|nr:response regulator [Gracilimonas sp.]MBD3615877.1 response regulator [Gracilimonas sp.]